MVRVRRPGCLVPCLAWGTPGHSGVREGGGRQLRFRKDGSSIGTPRSPSEQYPKLRACHSGKIPFPRTQYLSAQLLWET